MTLYNIDRSDAPEKSGRIWLTRNSEPFGQDMYMLIERLQAAVEHLSQLAPEQQEKLAEQIEDILDEALWDAQFADPRAEDFFDKLVADAQRGPLRPLPTPADLGDADLEESAEDSADKRP